MLADYISGIHHLGIVVPDLARAAAWYEEMLDFQTVYQTSLYYPLRANVLFLQQGNCMLELYQPAPHLIAEAAKRGGGVIDHFALDAPDFTNCAQRVYKRGARLHKSTPKGCVLYDHIGEQGVRGINFVGPNEEVVELCHDYNHAYGTKTGLQGWSHLAIHVSDLKESLAFYEQLGFHKTMDGYLDTPDGRIQIRFVEQNGYALELIQLPGIRREELLGRGNGRLDHVALAVSDAKAAFYECKKAGLSLLHTSVQELPIFDHGIRCFRIQGPDGECVECMEQKKW